MLDRLAQLPARSMIVLHGCCHNPTGADLDLAAWDAIADVMEKRGLVPLIDLAYLGLAENLEADAAPVRHLARRLPETLIAVSCSKNFALYKERVGLLIGVGHSRAEANVLSAHFQRIARTLYSMPPDHGAEIVACILNDATLRQSWVDELGEMTIRIRTMRELLAAALSKALPEQDFSWIAHQRGLFSILDLTDQNIMRLQQEQHVYLVPGGRMNVAGLTRTTIDETARRLAAVLKSK